MTKFNETTVGYHHYCNNCMGMFFRGILNYFADELYPFNYKVIATYNKAVEFFNKKIETGQEIDTQILPAITLDPSGEFLPEERGGKFLWQYPNLYPAFGAKLFDSIYKDNDMIVTPVFTRFSGNMEMICWLNSVYEYIDFRTLMIMWSGGINRIIRPKGLWSYIVLPDEILNYEYNKILVDGSEEILKIDWRTTDAVVTLIKNMNQERIVYPVLLTPFLQIENISDASQKHPGTDLAAYKLSITFKYEIDLPTFIFIKNVTQIQTIKVSVEMGPFHSKYNIDDPIIQLNKISNQPELVGKQLDKLKIFRIVQDQLVNANILIQGDYLLSCPTSSDIISYNPIVSGRLIFIENSSDWDRVEEGDIIYSSTFNDDVLSQMRIAAGFISGNDSLCYYMKSKASLLSKTALFNLIDDDIDILRSLPENTIVTIDPYNYILYLGELQSEMIPRDEPGWGKDVLDKLLRNSPRLNEVVGNLDSDNTKPDVTPINKIKLNFLIDLNFNMYYEFSDDDLLPNKIVTIQLPFNITVQNKDQIILISYIGKLDYNIHYTIDFINQIITLKIPAKEDEGVEIYYF